MALYDTRFGLPQSVANYLNQGLPDIYQNIYNPPSIGPITKMPVESEPLVDPLYPQTGGNQDGYSVYNPDPNMTRTSAQYSPYAYNRAMRDTELGTVSPNPDMYYPKESGLANLLNFVPYIGSIKRGIEFFKDKLPISRAGIFQNELLGGGFMLDNIGRIVSAPGKYNTPTGIMAGYNPVSGGALNFITGGKMGEPTTYGLDKAYDKRRETIAKALKKMGMGKEDIEDAIAGEYEGDAPINPITGMPTKLVDRLGFINQSQNLINKRKEMADIVFDRKVEERQKEKQRTTQQIAASKKADEIRMQNLRKAQNTGGGGGGERNNRTSPSPARTSPQSGMQAERTRSRDLGSMRGGVGR